MKTAHKFLIGLGIVGCIAAVVVTLQSGGHYSATITPLGDDTQVVVFVKDQPKYQILFEKKSTAQSARISPQKVSAPDWKEKFIDATLAPGRWTLTFHSTDIDIVESAGIKIGSSEWLPTSSSIKVHADGKAERVGQLDPNAPCNQCQMP